MFKNYLKTAFRDILNHKLHSGINITGLAIGLASCFLIILFIQDELSYDRHYKNADRIYRVAVRGLVNNEEINEAVTASLMARTLVAEYPEVEKATRLHHTPNMLVRYQDKAFNETQFMWVDTNYFEIFPAKMLYGDTRTALKEHHTVVMSETTARKYFDNLADALGKIVTYEDGTPYKVTGIIEDHPENSHFHCGVLSPLSSWEWNRREFWLGHYMYTYILLQKNSSWKHLESKFPEFVNKYVASDITEGLGMTMDEFHNSGGNLNYFLQPITDIHLHSHLSYELEANNDIKYIYIFSSIAFFILIIACINYMNLATVTSASRYKEIGIRKVLGSEKSQLIKQFLLESILLSFIALLLTLVLVEVSKHIFSEVAGKQISLNYISSWYIIPALLLIPVVVGVLAGIYPAFFLSSFQPVTVLKGSGTKSSKGRASLRNILVILQFSISIFLFICTFVIYSQMQYIKNKKLGFDKENVVVINRGWAIGQNPDGSQIRTEQNKTIIDAFKNDLLSNPQILSVSGCNTLPGRGTSDGIFIAEGAPQNEQHPINYYRADYDYAKTLKMELLEGRFFSREMASDSIAIVINESAAKILGFKKPYVGKRITFPRSNGFFLNIVGVVKDFHYQSLHHEVKPLILGLQNLFRTYVAVRIHPDNIPQTVQYIGKVWNDYIPYKPFDYYFFDDDYNKLYIQEQRTEKLFIIFSIVAILIASLGLFGLVSFTTSQRTKEIGIRKVLGASVANIVIQLSKQVTVWVIISNLIAWPLGWFFMRSWLQNFAYNINVGLWMFLLAGTITLLIALFTISFKAIKAASADPVKSLKYE